ncbi:MAG: hypothetical protein WCD79_11650 [Chthoniobacteraceae bacterium]
MRKLLLLIIIAAGVWYGYQRYESSKTDDTPPVATDSKVASTFFPTPAPTLASTCRPALLSLSREILGPLDARDAIEQDAASKKLNDLKPAIANLSSDPDYTRTVQAYAWIDQALKERAGYIARIQQDSKPDTTGLDKVPGQWHIKDTSLDPGPNKSVDINARNQASRASFFVTATANQWKTRANYYAPMIEQLLTPGR